MSKEHKNNSMNIKVKKPWATKDAMDQVYEMNLWGSNATKFYSGIGSHDSLIVTPYVDVVTSFLASFREPLIVCDLGCGDFNVGKELVSYSKKYIGIDIVADLISFNKEKFKKENLEFLCLDIAKDDLPFGNCALVRQVLQHLSNFEVQCILDKLSDFEYVIITEHVPDNNFVPNIDIISGQGIRLKKQSGLDVLAPPFNFEVEEKKEMLQVSCNNYIGNIVTTLYKTS